MINGEGGRLPEENRIDYLVDQTDTVSTIWMGLTMGCSTVPRSQIRPHFPEGVLPTDGLLR